MNPALASAGYNSSLCSATVAARKAGGWVPSACVHAAWCGGHSLHCCHCRRQSAAAPPAALPRTVVYSGSSVSYDHRTTPREHTPKAPIPLLSARPRSPSRVRSCSPPTPAPGSYVCVRRPISRLGSAHVGCSLGAPVLGSATIGSSLASTGGSGCSGGGGGVCGASGSSNGNGVTTPGHGHEQLGGKFGATGRFTLGGAPPLGLGLGGGAAPLSGNTAIGFHAGGSGAISGTSLIAPCRQTVPPYMPSPDSLGASCSANAGCSATTSSAGGTSSSVAAAVHPHAVAGGMRVGGPLCPTVSLPPKAPWLNIAGLHEASVGASGNQGDNRQMSASRCITTPLWVAGDRQPAAEERRRAGTSVSVSSSSPWTLELRRGAAEASVSLCDTLSSSTEHAQALFSGVAAPTLSTVPPLLAMQVPGTAPAVLVAGGGALQCAIGEQLHLPLSPSLGAQKVVPEPPAVLLSHTGNPTLLPTLSARPNSQSTPSARSPRSTVALSPLLQSSMLQASRQQSSPCMWSVRRTTPLPQTPSSPV
eukprot:NODE_242_length_3314_cov_6.244117.p1 GENE.NODE_242_length_3314_cov_6.244117~~NODE_242_length_3314_cov_6.244117.p1  ORF type:complete len:533 (+),score=101.16 NODE_242_length_3314_cov_6.244117:1488-3086(+)